MKDLTLEEIVRSLMATEFAISSALNIWDEYVQYHSVSMEKIIVILSPHMLALSTLLSMLDQKLETGEIVEINA